MVGQNGGQKVMSLLAIQLSEMIGLTILHSLWQITLLWIVLVAVLRLFPTASSAVRYTFAISILILSVLTTVGTAVYEWQLHTTSEKISELPNGTTQTIDIEYITNTQTLLSRIVDALNTSVPVLAWLWCAGLVVMGARFSGSFFYLRALCAQENIAAIPPVWEQELKRLSIALGLRFKVAIATSARISSPLTLGSLSPIILVPVGLLSGMSTAQIEAILVHELYHIKRRDYVINICQALVEVLLFYHPAIWHINNIIREERENCCDDQTLAFCGDAITYARALTQIQEINTLTKPTLAMSATGPNAGNFSNRIKRLFNIYPNPAQSRSKGIFAIGLLMVYLGIVLASANVSTAQSVEPEKEPMETIPNDYNTYSNIFSDSIPVSKHLYLLDGKEITPRQMSSVFDSLKIRSIDIQRADTTVEERTLDKCLRQVKLILSMATLPGERFRLSAADSLQFAGSVDYSAKTNLEPQPTRFRGTGNLSRTSPDLIDTTGIKFKTQEATPLLVIDGTPISRSMSDIVMKQIDPNSIISMTGYHGQQAIDLYGDEGKHGVIEIGLKPGTSIGEFTKGEAVQVFPNATNGSLNISFTPARNSSHVDMVLVDSNGTVVKEITDSTYDNIPTELRVDVSGYEKGIYILQINIDGAKSQQRVVVK
jgi:beta-lactamase regulating signal transducer with metallopeptidase domain